MSWVVHLRPGSGLIGEPEAVRAQLRQGNLASALLPGGPAPALLERGRSLTHDQLREQALRMAAGLAELGVEPGDRVGILAANSIQWVLAYLGAICRGAVVVPINPAYRKDEVEHILNDAGVRVVLGEGKVSLAPTRRIVDIGNLPEAAPMQPAELGPGSPALILYTSGTTGRPKGALLDHGNLLAQARGVIEAWRWEQDDRLLLCLPLFHLHGLGMGLHGTLITGASAVLAPFAPQTVATEIHAGATMFFGVPSMYQRLTDARPPSYLPPIRLWVSGSAPLPPPLFERCQAVLGQSVLERYGLTEGGIVVSNPLFGPRQPGRVGHPLPGVEVRLGERDEVLLRGGQVFSGYWGNPQATAEAFGDGWLRTGDAGQIGPDGSLAIKGRLKELIISGGFNVYPREVELVLENHPAVAEVVVAGLPSERWGEEVTAFVVARAPLTEADLIRFARDRLAPYKCPKAVRFVDVLPRNAMGKVVRSSLLNSG